jgi:hypothetical protein
VSAPPLPEVFGNYALGEFIEVVAPAAVSWLPQTVGWLWVGLALLCLSLHRGWKWLRHWYRNRYRREAAARFRLLAAQSHPESMVRESNRLLKLTALAAYSREQVARLSGPQWVKFLNSQCDQTAFNTQQGELLALGAYSTRPLDAATAQQLIGACQDWVRYHKNQFDV